MFVTGFTIARNVVSADYPLKEAVFSILPLCDEVIVAVGRSDDGTRAFVESFGSDKIRIIDTVWDDTRREGGEVLAIETNKALDAVREETDWCIYIQADECLHEKYHETVIRQMENNLEDKRVEGLLFSYVHFYGSYDYFADSREWYRHEIRVIRNDRNIRSWKDAQGFRKDGKKLRVRSSGAEIYHYGWVKHPDLQLKKLKQARKLWHSDEFLEKEYEGQASYDFSKVDSLSRFTGTHPSVMQERIKARNWQFEYDTRVRNLSLRKRILLKIEKISGWRPGENRNYKLI